MNHPDWYPDWRHDLVHRLSDKNARLESRYRIGQWQRFDYDLDAGTLVFSEQGVSRVIAEIQIVGSTSFKAGNWLWAWANSYWPPERVTDAELVRAFGQEHGICELTHDCIEDDELNSFGWAMTAVMVQVTGALGGYRPPRDEGGGLYLTYKNISWAS